MQAGNISQFLRWGYSSTGANHEVTGEDPAHGWIPSRDELYLVEESEIPAEPGSQ